MDFLPPEAWATLGVGGVLALVTSWWKKQDDKRHADEIDRIHRDHAEEIVRMVQHNQQMQMRLYEIGEKVTEALYEVKNGLDKNTIAIGGLANISEIAEQLRRLTNERRP